MDKPSPDQLDKPTDRPPILAAVLQALGFIDLTVTPVGILCVLALRVHYQRPLDGTFVAVLLGALIIGVTFGGLLIGLAAALRYAHQRARGYAAAPSPQGHDPEAAMSVDARRPAADQPLGLGSIDLSQIAALLTDIRDLQLLGPQEHAQAAERLRSRAERRTADDVIDAINTRKLGKARLLVRYAEAAYGRTPTIQKLEEKIAQAAKRNEALDFARTKRHVADAISANRWLVAEQYAHAVHLDHPESTRCRQLWDDTRRAHLYAHIQKCAEQHHWTEALAAAEEFLGRFPESREAQALRRQMDTLRTNAEILQRRQYEKRFKDFIGAEHYAEALQIARHVVEQFPNSPQAQALRDQIPLLERRVAGERTGPASPGPS